MPKKPKKYHKEADSQFYKLKSRAKLASILFISEKKLQFLAREENLYHNFKKPKSSGSGMRDISAPRADLKKVQARIAELLHRIAPPDYLFAPVAGRSYVDNAAVHLGSQSVRLLDIEDFFPKCTENKVIWFFNKRMQCSIDVAVILKGIVTKDGGLPQGSPCSPILAYFCYIDMWEEISHIVTSSGCVLSVYADDLTISGETVPEKAIWKIKQTLFRHGHRYNIAKERSKYKRPAEITGTILKDNALHAPSRQHHKLHLLRQELASEKSKPQREQLAMQIRGRESQIKQVTSINQSD